MASMKGGQRFTVLSSEPMSALNAVGGISLIQPGKPFAGAGGRARPF
jgi:hypothetical protein